MFTANKHNTVPLKLHWSRSHVHAQIKPSIKSQTFDIQNINL